MFDLRKILSDLDITEQYFADKLGITYSNISKFMNEKDTETQSKLYDEFVQLEIDDNLFVELTEFYKEFFTVQKDLECLIKDILAYRKGNTPRMMINSIQRLISLSDDIDQIREGDVGLKTFFIVVCIEALNVIAGNSKMSKTDMVIDFFKNKITIQDRQFITDNVKRSLADEKYNVHQREDETAEEYKKRLNQHVDRTFNMDIDIEEFALIINEMRNIFAHEGIHWKFTFSGGDYPLMNILDFSKCRYKYFKGWVNQERIYDVNLKYSDFRRICVVGFIKFTREHFASIR